MENQMVDDYIQSPTEVRPAAIEAVNTRQMQEVKAMVFMAKQFPRDISESYKRIMTACERQSLAENAAYQYPRGDTRVTGPSIRLAEVLAQNWGNIDFGVIELEQRPGESTAMSYCWDLETNVRQTKIFTVKHERHTRQGVRKLTDPRDVYEMVANQGARRLRACILGVIPGDIVEKALEKCQQTLMGKNKEPLIDRINVVLEAFDKEFSVSTEMIEKYFGYKISAFTEHDLVNLKKIGLAIRDGMAKREDYFDIKGEKKEVQSSVLADFEQKGQNGKGGVKSNEAEQPELPLEGSE